MTNALDAHDRVPDLVAEFLAMIKDGAVEDAVESAARAAVNGRSPRDVITSVLCLAQREVGERWHRARWSVGMEHQATAVTDAALDHVLNLTSPPPAEKRTLAVACAPGDAHTLAARMAAELLRLDGFTVHLAAALTPEADLIRWLGRTRPDGLVLTCSLPTAARAAHSVSVAAARLSIPTVVGGAGMGPDSRRADALGLRWAPSLADLEQRLDRDAPAVPEEELVHRLRLHDRAMLNRDEAVEATVSQLRRTSRDIGAVPARLRRFAEDIPTLYDHLATAALTKDNRVVTEYVRWWTTHLTARAIPSSIASDSVVTLRRHCPPHLASAIAAASDETPLVAAG